MASADEIAIRLGIKTGDLKAALADAGSEIRKFRETGEKEGASVGKIFDKIADKIGGTRDLSHALATAFGLNLEKIAEKAARLWTGMSEAEEEATKKLGESSDKLTELTIKNMRSQLSEEQQYQLALAKRDKLQKQIEESTATTAVQQEELNQKKIQQQEAIAEVLVYEKKQREEIARKQEEDARRMTDARNKEHDAALSVLSTDQQIAQLKDELVFLQTSINSGLLSQKDKEQANQALIARTTQLKEIQSKAEKSAADERKKALEELAKLDEKQADMNREELTLGQQQADLLKRRADLEHELAGLEIGTVEYNKTYNKLLENRQALKKNEEEISKANLELAQLMLIPAAQLTDVQRERIKILTGQTTEHKNQLELSALLKKGVENLTDEEKARLRVLTGQTQAIKDQFPVEGKNLDQLVEQRKQLEAQLQKHRDLADVTAGPQHEAEEGIVKELQDQLDKLDEIIAKKKAAAEIGGSLKQTGDIRNLSDVQLDQVVQNIRKQLSDAQRDDSMQAAISGMRPDYKSPIQYQLQQNLDQALQEQRLRTQFRQSSSFFGDDYLQRNYAPNDYQRLSQLINPNQSAKDSQNLATIATGLQNLFPDKVAGAIR